MKLVLLAEAEAELDDAAAWYEERRERLGDELLDEVREGLAVVAVLAVVHAKRRPLYWIERA